MSDASFMPTSRITQACAQEYKMLPSAIQANSSNCTRAPGLQHISTKARNGQEPRCKDKPKEHDLRYELQLLSTGMGNEKNRPLGDDNHARSTGKQCHPPC